jgi:hypothetical protein
MSLLQEDTALVELVWVERGLVCVGLKGLGTVFAFCGGWQRRGGRFWWCDAGQPGHCCLFLAQYSPQPFILCPECRYAVFPAPVCEPRLCVGGVLQYDHTAAERAQVGHDLSEMERGVCRLEALSF